MPRVHFVKVARKPIPHAGVAVGESYFWWKFRYGGRRVSKARPRPSQLTQSKLSEVYAAREELSDFLDGWDRVGGDPEGVADALDAAAERVREVAEAYGEAAEAMGGAGEANQEKADACEAYADALDDAAAAVREVAEEVEEANNEGLDPDEDWRERGLDAAREPEFEE